MFPKGSTYEQYSDSQPILDQLEQDIADVAAQGGLVLLAGDFNARTGRAADTLDSDISGDLLDATLQPSKLHALSPQEVF